MTSLVKVDDEEQQIIENLTADEILKAREIKVQKLALWEKLRKKMIHTVSKADIEALFTAFDIEVSGEITTEELMTLKKIKGIGLSEKDIKDICTDADKDGSGQVTVLDLYKAISTGQLAFNIVKKSLYKNIREFKTTECTVNDLIDWIHEDSSTREDLWSLPQTLFLFIVYTLSASLHINNDKAWWLHNTFAKEVDFGTLSNYPQFWVFDMSTFFAFMKTNYIPNTFRKDWNFAAGRYAKENQMVGGVRIRKLYSEGHPCENIPDNLENQYNVSSLTGDTCFRSGSTSVDKRFLLYHEDLNILQQRVENISKAPFFLDYRTVRFSMDTLTFNANFGTWTWTEVMYTLQPNGYMREQEFRETWTANPYSGWSSPLLDALYIFILLRILYTQTKAFIPALLNGLDAVADYLTFWTIMDWLTLFWGFLNAAIWFLVVKKISEDLPKAVLAYPQSDLDGLVYLNQTWLTPAQIESSDYDFPTLYARLDDAFSAAEELRDWHMALRAVCFMYMFLLVMKFFKAFRANKRLDVVVATLAGCVVDVAHFIVVFFAVFSGYSWAGFLFFGQYIKGFSTVFGVLFYCFRWGALSIGAMDLQNLSPFLQAVGYTYTLTYQCLVQILIFSILMSNIWGAYGRVCAAAGNPETVFKQVKKEISNLRVTMDFVDVNKVVARLEDDESPVHEGKDKVTVSSLRRAFYKEKMTKDNAEFLVQNASDHAKKKAGEVDMNLDDAIKLVSHIRLASFKLCTVLERLVHIVQEDQKKPQRKRYDAIMAGYEPDDPESMTKLAHDTKLWAALEDEKPHATSGNTAKDSSTRLSLTDGTRTKATKPMLALTNTSNSRRASVHQPAIDDEDEAEDEALVMAATSGQALEKRVKKQDAIIEQLGSITNQLGELREGRLKLQERFRRRVQQRQQQVKSRDAALMLKIKAYTDEAEQTEDGVGKLCECVKGVDFDALQAMPKAMLELLERIQAPRKAIVEVLKERGNGLDPLQVLEQKVDALSDQVANIVALQAKQPDFSSAFQKTDEALADIVRQTGCGTSSEGSTPPSSKLGRLPGVPHRRPPPPLSKKS